MKILFLTLIDIKSINHSGIYEDLLREFIRNGHDIYIVSPTERRNKEKTHFIKKDNCHILKVKTGNIQKSNFIEKGIATVMLESQFVNAIKRYYKMVKFDFVLYSTPPITLAKSVQLVKKRDGAKSYLLLKDIFPQNAVDIGLIKTQGIKGIIYKYFRQKEKKLYELSDYIGCMSQANVEYILKHNPEINDDCVEICPNCVEANDISISNSRRNLIRKKYHIPENKTVFVYGGNLGKPQGIDFLINCLKTQEKNEDVYFLIVGSGTEYKKINQFIKIDRPNNVKLISKLPKEDYDEMVGSCDIGMIFLDYSFTIPNFPSRLLSYMQANIPVLAVTDCNTDIGKVIVKGRFGWWCESNDTQKFSEKVFEILETDYKLLGINGYKYLKKNYSVENGYNIIMKRVLN